MRIYYPTRSRFLRDCENSIHQNKDAVMAGVSISIKFSPKGYNGKIRVNIEKTNPKSFQTSWKGSDPTRFPVRIKVAAYALFRQNCFGDFVISHNTGILTIQRITSPFKNNRQYDENEDISTLKSHMVKTIKTNSLSTNEELASRSNQLFEILAKIPWDVWGRIVSNEPEWYNMQSSIEEFGYGPFAVLMLTTGLNDYQLKGKAETAYWPKICSFLKNSSTPKSPRELCTLLESFYRKERFNTIKIQRLNRFLDSSLASELWENSPHNISDKFLSIWKNLADTMGQKPQDKTISFAMKCLGISLLMIKEYKFDFTSIPIPADLRVVRFTKKAGISLTETSGNIRDSWTVVLSLLQSSNPDITMIHLDSLIWQIASLNKNELQNYFENMGISVVGEDLSIFLQDSLSDKQNTKLLRINGRRTSSISNESARKKILVLFPCSGRKSKHISHETFEENNEEKVIDFIENTKPLLTRGREGLSTFIDHDSTAVAALDRYNGFLYSSSPDFRDSVKIAFFQKDVHVLIMSGAYGILTPSERIPLYNKQMNANYWNRHGLPRIIKEYIVRNKITHVYGFFSISTDYMKIMISINWQRLKESSSVKVARTYYIHFQGAGGAQVVVPQTTGAILTSFIKSNFDQDNFYKNPFHGQYVEFINHL